MAGMVVPASYAADNDTGTAAAVNYASVPKLLITEIVPDSENVQSSDAYEFLEIYNNSTQPINLKDYQLIYHYGTTNNEWTPTSGRDVIIEAKQSVVLWVMNTNNLSNKDLTADQFNANYGTSLIENVNLFRYDGGGGMHYSSPRDFILKDGDGTTIVTASYENDDQTQKNKGIFYHYPLNGSAMMTISSAGLNAATPGTVEPDQAPPVASDEASSPPVEPQPALTISHTAFAEAIDDTDLVIAATIEGEAGAEAVSGTLYYAIGDQSDYTPLTMTHKEGASYEATIPHSAFTSDQLRYYIEATDGANTAKSTEYTVVIRPSFDYTLVPPLLITELVPDSTNVDGSDGYEFVEVYNNTDQTIDLTDYKLIYRHTDTNEDEEWSLGSNPILIPSQQTIAIWVMNGKNAAKTAADFNTLYGSSLVEGINLFRVSNDGMSNGGLRKLILKDARGYEVSSAFYESDTQTIANKGIHYTYPDNGSSEMVLLTAGTEAATPGTVADKQVPQRPVTLPPVTEENQPPVITHTPVTAADTEEHITIDAVITNPENATDGAADAVTAKVFYKTASQSTYSAVEMTVSAGNEYRGIIPREALTEASLQYYIEAKDAANTVKSETYAIAIDLPDFDFAKVPALLVTELVPNSTNVDGADGYEFIEIYNNTDKPVNFKDYKVYYRYTDSGPDADIVWPTDREDLIIPSKGTFVFWVINSKNKAKTVADFNAQYHTNLVENVNIAKVYSDGMANGSKRGVMIGTNTHAELSAAYYDGAVANETKDNMGILYKYPLNGTTSMLKYSTGTTFATPGTLEAGQAPQIGLTVAEDATSPKFKDLTGVSSADQANNLELVAEATDDRLVTTMALYYKTDNQASYAKRYLYPSYDDTLYHHTIYSPELIGRSYVDYYYEISDGANTITTEANRIAITGGNSRADVRLNVADGDILSGTPIIKGTAEQAGPETLTMKVDGKDVSAAAYPAVEDTAYFAFDANSVNYYFKNGVTIGQEILYTFMDPINSYTTLSVPIDADRLQEGDNVIAIRAGTKSSPFDDRAEENKDDFTVKNVRLVLSNGTVLYDPAFSNPETEIKMGDSSGRYPALDFHFTLPLDKLTAKAYALDTKALADGDHTITVSSAQYGEVSAKVKVDNTAPTVVPSVQNGKTYRGAFSLDAQVSDALAGVDQVEATLDGEPIELPYATSSSKLAAGSHSFVIQATDKIGNAASKTVAFEVPDENPLPAELVKPVVDAADVNRQATLSVKVTDPTKDAMNVSFYKGYNFDANTKSGFAAFKNANEVEPPKVKIPAGEQAFTADDYALIGKEDGEYLITDSDDQFPYQRFEVTLDSSVKATDNVQLAWKGKSLEGRKVSLYAWNPTSAKWDMLDHFVAGTADFELTAQVKAGTYAEDQKIQVMVQDELPVSQEPYDFSFVWMSDTQYYSESYPEIYQQNVQWIVDQQKDMNIQYVIHTGDIVDEADQEYQWIEADKDMKVLEDAKIPYGVLAGNHDVTHQTGDYSHYWQWFGEDRFKVQPTFGESYQNNRGHYDLVSAGGVDFIIVYMGWNIGDAEIDWVNEVVQQHPDRKAILAFHEYLLVSGNRAPIADEIYERVVIPNKNVFATLSGHYHDAETLVDEIDDNGDGTPDRKVYQMLADYQGAEKGGLGYMRLLQFDTKNDKVYVKTYSPLLDDYNYYDPKEAPGKDEFELNVDLSTMTKRVATDYMSIKVYTDQLIGQTRAASGKQASVTWSDLEADTYYQWYAVAEDANSGSSLSPIWGFTTGTSNSSGGNYPGGSGTTTSEEPSTSTPTDGANANVTVSPQADGSYSVDQTMLDTAAQAGQSTIQITLNGANASESQLTLQLNGTGLAKVKDKGATLQISTPALTLHIPASSLPSGLEGADTITLSMNTAADGSLKTILNQATSNGSPLRATDIVFTFTLQAADNGQQAELHQFAGPIRIERILSDEELKSIDPDYAGVYYMNGDEAQYMGGTINGNVLTFTTDHFSSFALMEYRKNFTDMAGNWAAEYVGKLAAKHLVTGIDADRFGPNLAVTRAEFATIAVRALGYETTAASSASAFTDVVPTAYYADYVAQAAEIGIIQGSDGKFRPTDTITREEASVILIRLYEAMLKQDTPNPSASANFTDMAKASPWSVQAIAQAQALGLVNGKGAGQFDPAGTVTRAETAKMIYMLVDLSTTP